jgi:hypothetical protein
MQQKLTLLFLLLSFCIHTNAQQTKQRVKIMQTDSSVAIPYANIQLKNKSTVFMADENGFAMLDIFNGDTILVNSIGYFPTQLVYSTNNALPVLRIYMVPKNINLKEVTIKGISSKEELKMAILRMRIEEKQKDMPGLKTYHGPMKKPAAGVMSPISMIYESQWAKKQRAKKWSKSLIMPSIK